MMIKRRIDEDFKHVWAINWNGLPEDFSDATEIVLTASVYGKKTILERGIDYEIEGNLIIVDFTPRFVTIPGIYNLELKYIKPCDGFIDGERRSAIDIDVVQIVARSSQVTDTGDITSTSEAAFGFQGLSAYEVWLKDNPDKTKEDYYAWLQKPATDAVVLIEDKIEELDTAIQQEEQRELAEGVRLSNEQSRVEAEELRVTAEALRATAEASRVSAETPRVTAEAVRVQAETERETAEATRISNENNRVTAEQERVNAESLRVTAETSRQTAESLRVEAELLRQSNTQEAILNAENATENANTAAQNADNARLAIQDDLALKANHGYESNPKTLKEVDDEKADQADLVQLAGDVEQLAYVKIKNEAVNGNFENGLIAPFAKIDGFGGASTLAINSSAPISGNYDIRLTITTLATAAARPLLQGLHGAANIGEKIYLHFYAKILSGTPYIGSINNGSGTSSIYGGYVINGRNTRIIDVARAGTNDVGLIYFNSFSVWDMQMDNFMRINLTETFGAGNEPTKEEMDLLISILGIDYFEGEITIPAQKIMQWQLALIRKNKNAIIALGGTII